MVKAIPDGFHAVTPHITVRGAAAAIEFYKQAFGAEDLGGMAMPNDPSVLMHAMIRIGDSMIMLNDEFPDMQCMGPASIGGTPVTLHLYVPDVDKAMAQAEKAGATVVMPAADMFWGDRYGKLVDPFGHHWSLATHVKDLSSEEIAKGAEAAFQQAG